MRGLADYKLKFGTIYAYVPRLKFAKYKIFLNFTQNLKVFYYRYAKKIIENIKKMTINSAKDIEKLKKEYIVCVDGGRGGYLMIQKDWTID